MSAIGEFESGQEDGDVEFTVTDGLRTYRARIGGLPPLGNVGSSGPGLLPFHTVQHTHVHPSTQQQPKTSSSLRPT